MQLPNRQNNFDGLRLIASLMVLVSHQFVLSGRSEPLAIGRFTYGTLGVLVFFSLSGYLIAGSWLRDPHLFSFTKKRLLRIWPALAVCVVTLTTICIIAQPDRINLADNLQRDSVARSR
ncbi:acyltransferase family protein [Variovorax sp. LT1P1]|uniref:acyltransferase family protein n=1 Tax=Variovorax sp. LT1P1 TaxID=3443730 RepID=UPI003F47D2EA